MSYKKRSKPQYTIGRQNRLKRSLAQVRTIMAKPQYIKQWQVQSHSNLNKFYKVSLAKDGHYECSCPQWIYRRKECKHIQEVMNMPVRMAPVPTQNDYLIDEYGAKQYKLL